MIPFNNGRTAEVTDFTVGTVAMTETDPMDPTGVAVTEYTVDADTLAVIFEPDGTVYDLAGNLDTAVTMVNEGLLALAVRGEGLRDRESVQNILDSEARDRADCFGAPWAE